MRRSTRNVTQALLCLAPALGAWTVSPAPLDMEPESRLWIKGSSTLRGFECKADSFTTTIESTVPHPVAAILAGEKGVGSVEVRVVAGRLECGNGTMNEHMRKALKAKDNPVIVFRVASYELEKAPDGVKVVLTGTLGMGGTEKPVTLTATATTASSEMLRVAGSYELRLSDYGLKAPTLMLGTLKVDDRVKVAFDLVLKD